MQQFQLSRELLARLAEFFNNQFDLRAREKQLLVNKLATVASYNSATQRATVYFAGDPVTPSCSYVNRCGAALSPGDKVYVFHKYGEPDQGWIMIKA